MNRRGLIRIVLLVGSLLGVGNCYDPEIADCAIRCGVDSACPRGFHCDNGSCTRVGPCPAEDLGDGSAQVASGGRTDPGDGSTPASSGGRANLGDGSTWVAGRGGTEPKGGASANGGRGSREAGPREGGAVDPEVDGSRAEDASVDASILDDAAAGDAPDGQGESGASNLDASGAGSGGGSGTSLDAGSGGERNSAQVDGAAHGDGGLPFDAGLDASHPVDAGEYCSIDATRELSCSACDERACGGYLWRNGWIPYELHPELLEEPLDELRDRVLEAAAAWSASAERIEFVRCEADDCEGEGRRRWVEVRVGSDYSHRSEQAGEEGVELRLDATPHQVAHQLGHVIGLVDVWQRPDRDRYLALSASVCDRGNHVDAVRCKVWPGQASGYPARPTGFYGPFDATSKMSWNSDLICETAAEPAAESGMPTRADGAAVSELYSTLDQWAPFQPLEQDLVGQTPFDYRIVGSVDPVGSPALATAIVQDSGAAHTVLHLWVRGSNRRLYSRTKLVTDGAFEPFSAWADQGGLFDSDPALVARGSRVDVVARRSDGMILWSFKIGNEAWAPWQHLGAPPGGAIADPAIASSQPGRIDVVVRGGNGFLYHKSFSASPPAFGVWNSIGNQVIRGKPAIASIADGKLDVVVSATTAGLLLTLSYDQGAWSSGYLPLPADFADGSTPALLARSGNLILYLRAGSTHRLVERVRIGGAWGPWNDLGGLIAGSPSAAGLGHIHVVVPVNDNGRTGLWWRYWPYQRPCYVDGGSESDADACGTCGCSGEGRGPDCDG